MVDVSKTGEPVYIKDFAKVERRYQDPVFLVRYDGKPSVLLSVEMQKGKNVTELGDRLDEIMTQLRSLLPPDIKVDLIADQPTMVRERISHLGHEFLLAIGSVILVTIILLPIRVAADCGPGHPGYALHNGGDHERLRYSLAPGIDCIAHRSPRHRRRRCYRHRRQLCRAP